MNKCGDTQKAAGCGLKSEHIRVRGIVQGVGFRPTVWRIARDCGLLGDVRNDGEGVLVRVHGHPEHIDGFCRRLRSECPPLARIDALERSPSSEPPQADGFSIVASQVGEVHTGVVADAATCRACRADIFDSADRRYRYPFTNCTHCGPRLSIVRGIPYDRANTSMSEFSLCHQCRQEYEDPAERRFHAQPNACPVCGPRVWLEDGDGGPWTRYEGDVIGAASRLLAQGRILAIKGIGGFHLACDAGSEEAVGTLRARKRRFHKPFALMARDLAVIQRYCAVNTEEAALLSAPAAPILLLERTGAQLVAPSVAEGQSTLGFMLPYSPLHHLLLEGWDRPLVMTSGNLSDQPQCTHNGDAVARLTGLADFFLLHDREIVNRVDDSVLRVMHGKPRFLRRARGYAPTPIALPPGFEGTPPILAMGADLKSTVCLVKDGQAMLSQHLGDLDEIRTSDEYERTIELYQRLFQHQPHLLVADRHPGYRSSRIGSSLAESRGLDLLRVQHHFAHIASVLADNRHPLTAGPVIGIALDGLGYGDDGTLWGGEFLLADYRGSRRLACLKAVPMPGATKAILEPWRSTFAHLITHLGWDVFRQAFPRLEITRYLLGKPVDALSLMVEKRLNTPMTSSCGRLFDAVAGALDVSRDGVSYEGQAAMELEALAIQGGPCGQGEYRFHLDSSGDPMLLDPTPIWWALLQDLQQGLDRHLIAARFHAGLAKAVADLGLRLAKRENVDTVALSGGVFQNKTLFEAVAQHLQRGGLTVFSHERVPSNDGGLALGQALVAAAGYLENAGAR